MGAAPADILVAAACDGNLSDLRAGLEEAGTSSFFHVDACDKFGRGLLWFAVANGHLDAAELLLDSGAEVNCQDMLGWRPLHLASYNGEAQLVRLCLEWKADVDARTHAGQTARWLAHSATQPGSGPRSVSHGAISALLEEAGGTLGLPPKDWQNPRRPKCRRQIPPDEVRCCREDGLRYTIGELIQTYVFDKEMYTIAECEDYFRKEMHQPADNHATWQLQALGPLMPGENKYG